jgi:DNA-binding HxlR family transcriptional regulator
VPLRSDWSMNPCPMARAIDVVGDPWTLLILRDAFAGSRRYEEFLASLRISPNVLSSRLKSMVESGLLRKSPYASERRTRHEYLLSPAGEELLPVVHALSLWGQAHGSRTDHVPMEIVHTRCGQPTTRAELCSNCGEALRAGEVAWRRPWLEENLRPVVGAPDS